MKKDKIDLPPEDSLKALRLENDALKRDNWALDCVLTAQTIYPDASDDLIQNVATELMRLPLDSVREFRKILRQYNRK